MFDDGSKMPLHEAGDRTIEPTGRHDDSSQPSRRFFKPQREIADTGQPIGGGGFGSRDRNGKPLRVTDAQVEVEFVINTNGTV